jgi:hypothetical protein
MKIQLSALLLLLGTFTISYVSANDGMYLTKGGAIYPTKETKISMDKEHLSFKVVDGKCSVNIAFEFNNPEKVERKLLIGFQAPTAVGDVDEDTQASNMIEGFQVMQNNQILPYTLKIAECEDCELVNIGDWKPAHQADDGVFVYLFEVTFQPGMNKINHSYSFPASSSVYANQFYNYILTTGAKWAGGKIKDLTIDFDFGDNSYFYVSDIFGTATWNIIGTGKATSQYVDNYDDGKNRMIRVLSGMLQVTVKDLTPEKNIEFGVFDDVSFIHRNTDEKRLNEETVQELNEYYIDEANTKDKLRILRNTIYAQHGLSFSSKDLQTYFSQFDWYMADPNLKQSEIKLSDEESRLLDMIIRKEEQLLK